MLFHKDMLNRNPYYPNELNPYTDNILESIAKLSKSDPDTYNAFVQLGAGDILTPEDKMYGMNLLDINAIQGMTPEEGWTVNKLTSPEFIDLAKQSLKALQVPNIDNFKNYDLQNWYQTQAHNMLKANPYSTMFNPTTEEMLNPILNKLMY